MDDDGGEAMVPATVRLRPDQWDAIEEIAARTGTDRDAVIRRLIGLGLAQLGESEEGDAS